MRTQTLLDGGEALDQVFDDLEGVMKQRVKALAVVGAVGMVWE